MIKKALKAIGILLLVLIIAAVAIPYFFKDRIVEAVKKDINMNFNAKVDFADVNLSLFKSFPDFNLSLDQLSVTGMNEFEGYKLIDAEHIEFSLDLMSVIRADGPVEINTISLQKPNINIRILRDGKANYDIVKANEAPVEESITGDESFLIQLEKYEIVAGKFVYDDRLGGTYVEIEDLDHEGRGEFTQDVFDLITTTDIGSLTAKSGGVAYLNKAKGAIDLTLNADIKNSKFTIKENSIVLNALKLYTEGFVQLAGDKINVDINFKTPQNNFKSLLSMIPSAYTADFKDVQANGLLELGGFIKGDYDVNSGSLPAFLVNLKIENGDFKYPDLPLGMKGINTLIKISSPSSNLNKMVVDISHFKMELGNNPFEAKVKLWTLISDPTVDAKLNGKINLAELAKAFPLEGVSSLNGVITSNLTAKASMSAIDAKNYENIEMAGDLSIENLDYQSDDNPQIQIVNMQMNFSPEYVKLERFDAKLGKSDITADGTIDNVLAYFSPDKTMTGKLKIRSDLFDANEWISEEDDAQPNIAAADTNTKEEVFERFEFAVDGEIKRILYDTYDLRDSKFLGQVTPGKATISIFQTKLGESDFKMDGEITNIFNYVFENETLRGDLNLVSNYINANEFMLDDVPEEEMVAIPVPEKMDLNITAEVGEVLFTNIPLRNVKGKMKVENEVIVIKDANAKTMGGDVIMNGSYNTQSIEEPKFVMDYKLSSLNYQDAFDKLNTFEALAPIGKFIEGKLNTTLSMSGILGKDMLPVLSTLSANGILETVDGNLKNFKPLEEFANKLNLDFLKSIDLKNTKNWFEVNNGEVTIRDFDYKTNGIDMVIGGTHGLNSEMAYHIKAKIPRKILQQNAVGQAADKGLNFLQSQASKLGINIDQGEFVNVEALISGTITKPIIKLNLLGSDGKATTVGDIADNIKDQAIDKVSETIEDKTGIDVKNIEEEVKEVKEDLSDKADAEIAALMQKTEANIDKIMSEAESRANQTKLEAKKLSDKTRAEGYKQADELIEKAGDNIFKKKAAEVTAKKLKETTDEKADQILKKGDDTAKVIMESAKKQTDELQAAADAQAEEIRKQYQ